ncbi:OmpA family protein [Myroides marinus]|uniref:OmpA family protein n=1 Tax=Myroides marinus TaxID=703342 RepID=UPI002574CCF2|nr:OmpA family protein [Myroides marinus]MDM1405540.1 OmpA family protein [Myroides marinus]
MIRQIVKLVVIGVALGFSGIGYSQIKKEKQANKYFDNLNYTQAIKRYQSIANQGKANYLVLRNLADAYYFTGKLQQANKWYEQLFKADYKDKDLSQLPSEYYYRYAQTLKSVGDYYGANQIMDEFADINQHDSRAKRYLENKDYVQDIDQLPKSYKLELLDLNSKYSDYGATILNDKLIFTSARDTTQEIHTWTNEPFTKLYQAKIIEKQNFSQPELFAPELDFKINEATAVFTKDGNTMYFTANSVKKNGKGKKNKENKVVLKIYKATRKADGKWGLVLELPFNMDSSNTSHPALSADQKWLYFVSDREGTYGESDLFRVEIYDNGDYGPVQNLGNTINTESRETFPFISSDNQLYFCSDGHLGLGGLDVFVAEINQDGSFTNVTNLGKGINSNLDDFGFYYNQQEQLGFVSSNRDVNGTSNLYRVKKCANKIKGIVYDKDSRQSLDKVSLIVRDSLTKKQKLITTDQNGEFLLANTVCEFQYSINVQKSGYHEENILVENQNDIQDLEIALQKVEGQKQESIYNIKLSPIYFDFDKSIITKEATIELSKVVKLMKAYPSIRLEVGAHTDSRGNESYNLKLSQRRVDSTIHWIISHGIEPERLTGKAYGEQQLLNKCSDGVSCSKDKHRLNRRSEFSVIEL